MGGVSFWNVRETGGQEGHFGPVSVKPQHSDFSRKTVFVLDTIIELLLKRSGDNIKFVAGPLAEVSSKLSWFLEVSLR